MASAEVAPAGVEELPPREQKSSMEQALQSLGTMNSALDSLDMRADPDAQATVTDFLDFTEYLPADMTRSLTLIGQLDHQYVDASANVHELTTKWGELPSVPQESRTAPLQLRADISENLRQVVNTRIYSFEEAQRMHETVNRHYNRAKSILSKLTTMLENYPAAEEQAALAKSPQMSRAAKVTVKTEGQKGRRPRVPRITVPGDVLAPYDLNFDEYTSESDISSSSSSEEEEDRQGFPIRATPGTQPRIKVLKNTSGSSKPPKASKHGASLHGSAIPILSTSLVLSQLKPPPENAVIGSADAPWGQLTPYELAKLRKRMKKNAAWAPSETMIARELKNLGRGMDAYRAAKKKAEEEGRPFDGDLPAPVIDPETGVEHMPLGSLSIESLTMDDKENNLSNRGMKLNEAKKLKREQLAKLAAEEAEESTRKMFEAARAIIGDSQPNVQDQSNKTASKAKQQKKRKRDSVSEADTGKPDVNEIQPQKTQVKRTKTETPVPPPQLTSNTSQVPQETPGQASQRVGGSISSVPHSTTPIPPPIPGQEHNQSTRANSATSPAPSNSGAPNAVTTTIVLLKPPAETQITAPLHSPKKSTTPILPPVRETRKTQAARKQEQQETLAPLNTGADSRATSPAILIPKQEPDAQPSSAVSSEIPTSAISTRRPSSRSGKAASQEPQSSLAADRTRRTSTARNTPAPEKVEQTSRPAGKRAKRPVPGVISRTNSGGNSAVGARKAAPKKKSTRTSGKGRGDKATGAADAADAPGSSDLTEIEVDDEGKEIPKDEPRYCLCNQVSWGMMIQCDNVDNCKQEWFHLECVGLTSIPARTTKWYCPDCRKLLNIGEKGEVNARGVKA